MWCPQERLNKENYQMTTSISTAIRPDGLDGPDQPGYAKGGEDAAAEGLIAEPESGAQPKRMPVRREKGKRLVTRNNLPKRESEFMPAMSMEVALARRAAMVEFTRRIMVRNQDFGDIPGTGKPALLKPGAEKLCSFFGLEPEFIPVVEEIDWTGTRHGGETFCYVRYRCRLLREYRILGVGEGSCNSWESRYRYHWVTTEHIREDVDRTRLSTRGGHRTHCEFEFAVERAETTGAYGKPEEYWKTFTEAIRSGTARRVERDSRQGKLPAWEIDVDTTLYRILNQDVADLINTIQKMAQKRALVAATLIATSASEFFTQDVEDNQTDLNTFVTTAEDVGSSHSCRLTGENAGNALHMPEGVEAAGNSVIQKPWKNFGQMRQFFEHIRERVGETRYFEELGVAGVANPAEFRSAQKALQCYSRLVRIAAEPEVA